MGTTSPIENAIYDLKGFVESNIAVYLGAIEAEKGDGISLPVFEAYQIGYKSPFGHKSYPVVMFVPEAIEVEPGNQVEDIELTIAVVFALTGRDPEEMVKKAMRYSDALRALIADDASLGSTVSIAQVDTVEYFPAPPGDRSINVTVLSVRIIVEEII